MFSHGVVYLSSDIFGQSFWYKNRHAVSTKPKTFKPVVDSLSLPQTLKMKNLVVIYLVVLLCTSLATGESHFNHLK